jgi:hypothetical protein
VQPPVSLGAEEIWPPGRVAPVLRVSGFLGCEPQLLSYRLPVKVYVLRANLNRLFYKQSSVKLASSRVKPADNRSSIGRNERDGIAVRRRVIIKMQR